MPTVRGVIFASICAHIDREGFYVSIAEYHAAAGLGDYRRGGYPRVRGSDDLVAGLSRLRPAMAR